MRSSTVCPGVSERHCNGSLRDSPVRCFRPTRSSLLAGTNGWSGWPPAPVCAVWRARSMHGATPPLVRQSSVRSMAISRRGCGAITDRAGRCFRTPPRPDRARCWIEPSGIGGPGTRFWNTWDVPVRRGCCRPIAQCPICRSPRMMRNMRWLTASSAAVPSSPGPFAPIARCRALPPGWRSCPIASTRPCSACPRLAAGSILPRRFDFCLWGI